MSMPELGSKISLISKADIRYEGKLFTVDPQECTIALSHGNIFKKLTITGGIDFWSSIHIFVNIPYSIFQSFLTNL